MWRCAFTAARSASSQLAEDLRRGPCPRWPHHARDPAPPPLTYPPTPPPPAARHHTAPPTMQAQKSWDVAVKVDPTKGPAEQEHTKFHNRWHP